ncbi:MAG: CehA/McbA family metallohydrolase [Chloroflexota bacterium]|nr:CehA/McbA family metallohydrolase [Chloroflexota bacterium]
MREKIRIEGVLTPENMRLQYHYNPFVVPPGARRMEVSYYYDDQVNGAQETSSGNNVDIGVFDTRGADFLTGGFRGWSGGARSNFYIESQAATPGYLRGPLQPGEWTIIFGCSKIDDPAVRFRVNIDLDIDPTAVDEPVGEPRTPDRPAAHHGASAALAAGGRWYRGDLHAHSEHSDGWNTVEEIVRYTRNIGLDYFALTDHNTISHWDELARLNDGAPLLIAGEEITMYGGHANVWGLDGWIDFRGSDSSKVQQLLEDANRRGSMFSINHPDSPIPWKHPSVRGYQAVEVWNAPWRYFNEPALLRWEDHLKRGERMIAVGGSDSHCIPPAKMTQPNGPGEPCTWVYIEGALTERAVLDAVARGNVFISEAPNGPFIELRADADGDGVFEVLQGDRIDVPAGAAVRFHVKYRGPDGKHVRFFSKQGLVREVTAPVEEFDDEFELRLEGDDFVRVEVRGFRGRPERGEVVHAMTNPIYWGNW